jgi:hypothetical protein
MVLQVAAQQGAYVARMINRGYSLGVGGMDQAPPVKIKDSLAEGKVRTGVKWLPGFAEGLQRSAKHAQHRWQRFLMCKGFGTHNHYCFYCSFWCPQQQRRLTLRSSASCGVWMRRPSASSSS